MYSVKEQLNIFESSSKVENDQRLRGAKVSAKADIIGSRSEEKK